MVTQLREDEVGKRGWLLYDTKTRESQFMPIDSRQLFVSTLKLENAKPEEIRNAVENEAKRLQKEAGQAGALIRIMVKGTLAAGFGASDIRMPHLGENIYVDNLMNSENLRERIGQIKLAREKKMSAHEQGMAILKKKLEDTGYSLGDPEKLFEELVDGSALAGIKEKIEKEGKEKTSS